ncbi:MAG: hypothetical protein WC488_04185 [Candidatus Micrarchaeia archaeon]
MDKKEKEKELHRLVSLTFDEKPEIRRGAALQLADSGEPAALFALIELSYDKDETVKSTVQEILSKKKSSGDKNAISFADLFAHANEKEEAQQPALPTPEEDLRKKQLLSPIEQIFEKKLGKNKAAMVKDKMMSTIEKIYLKAVGSRSSPNPTDAGKREKAMQKMLTSYADILSMGLDEVASVGRHGREEKIADVQTIQESASEPPMAEDAVEVLEQLGTGADASKISKDLASIVDEEEEIRKEISSGAEGDADKSIFRRAYDVMMASDGDEQVMFEQSQKLMKRLGEEVDFAFKMAKQRFKAENITHLTELRNGMRSVNTDLLTVKSAEAGEYMRTKTKKDSYTRITANDSDGSEGIIYLFEGRGSEVRPEMRIKVVKGQVKTFEFSKETAITVGKKGSVYIVL